MQFLIFLPSYVKNTVWYCAANWRYFDAEHFLKIFPGNLFDSAFVKIRITKYIIIGSPV